MISGQVVSAVGNHLWQSTIVAAIAALLSLALRKNSAQVRHWLWMCASLKFIVPISLIITAGSALRPAAPQPVKKDVSVMMGQIAQPFSGITRTTVSSAAEDWSPGLAETTRKNKESVFRAFALLWLCGFTAIVFVWVRRWRKLSSAIRETALMGSIENIGIASSKTIMEPGVFGITRPVIVVPEGITDRLTAEQFSAVIAHELAHVRRHDNLTAALHMRVEAAFWFHPMVWWIGKRLVEEREQACDDAVLESGNQAETYAEGIVSICKLYLESPLPCVAGVTGSNLKQRIARIVTQRAAKPLDLGRRLLLGLIGVLSVAGPLAFGFMHVLEIDAQVTAAPDVTGTWQGTLHAQRDLRTVLKISKDNGLWKAQLYSIDQGAGSIPTSSFTVQGSTVKYAIMAIDGTYEGKLSADGNTITGTWTQGNHPLALELKRATPGTEWTIPEAPARPKPMPADANPVAEVATIKPSKPDQPGQGFIFDGHRFKTMNTSVVDLLTFAYGVQQRQVIGGESWTTSEKYDLEVEPSIEGAPSDKQLKSMTQKLLADRLKLQFHHDNKELAVYALVTTASGPKMTKSSGDPNGLPGLFFRGLGVLTVQNATMHDFAALMQSAVLDRPIVDKTALTDRFDFLLKWTPDESQFAGLGIKIPAPSNAPDAPPNLFAAVQDQLGLKLDSTKASVDVMVIDHVEKPSAN
jgi:uncharacterized protein (TIGR03435 family)